MDERGHTFSPLPPGVLMAHYYIRCMPIVTVCFMACMQNCPMTYTVQY